MSQPSVTKPASKEVLLAERQRNRDFAVYDSEPAFRLPLTDLYNCWEEWNKRFFSARLALPHLCIDPTPPRCLGDTRSWTGSGAEIQITISQAVVFGSHRVVVNRWPAEGTKRFIRDILAHEMIHQYQFEVSGNHEAGYRGHGPEFAARCNCIGEEWGLTPVMPRRRGRRDAERAIANFWPHNVRPPDFYAPDIALDRIIDKPAKPQHQPNCCYLLLEQLRALLVERGGEETLRFIEAELAWRRARRVGGEGFVRELGLNRARDEIGR